MKATPSQTAAQRRALAEATLIETTARVPEELAELTPDAIRQILHELRVHQIELEMQNEELRQSQLDLHAARARYFDLYDLAPVGYVTLSKEGLCLEANLTVATMLNVTRGDLRAKPFSRFIDKDDRDVFYLLTKQAFETGVPQSREVRLLTQDGTRSWALLNASTDDAAVLRISVTNIAAIKAVDAALAVSLTEKLALVKEVHHRVKNNLQVITSLLRLEGARCAHPDTKSVLEEMRGRIRSMAMLHEALYHSGTVAGVDLDEYLTQIARELFAAHNTSPALVQLRLNLGPVHAEMDQALPCGLIVNELLANAMEHGFPSGRRGEVLVELHTEDEGRRLRLRVSDTGVGLPTDFATRPNTTLGLQLVSDLAGQLGGTLDIGPGPGAVFTVTCPIRPR